MQTYGPQTKRYHPAKVVTDVFRQSYSRNRAT